MTATDELRAMLDECGVEWRKWDYFGIDIGTIFSASGIEWIVIWDPKANNLSIANYKINHTAEQIIAATLGAGTCQGHMDQEYFDCHLVTFNCMACGWEGVVDSGFVDYRFKESDMPNFCPNCGRKVMDE